MHYAEWSTKPLSGTISQFAMAAIDHRPSYCDLVPISVQDISLIMACVRKKNIVARHCIQMAGMAGEK